MTAELVLMRGLPGSGKTTAAREWMAENPTERVRTNRDDLRSSTYDASGVLDYSDEQVITSLQRHIVRTLLRAGKQVVVDDMNLRQRYARDWADLAFVEGADFSVMDITTNVEMCVLRDRWRGESGGRCVGEDVIRKIAARFPVGRWPEIERREDSESTAWEPYVPVHPSDPSAFIVDLDGTLAKKRLGEGERGWYEYERVGEDLPNTRVSDLVRDVRTIGNRIVFMSGRKDYSRAATRAWLEEHVGPWTAQCELHMRGDEDNRADDLVKYELFNAHVRRERFNVVGVFDDRDRVVRMWREIGLQVYQVAPGAF